MLLFAYINVLYQCFVLLYPFPKSTCFHRVTFRSVGAGDILTLIRVYTRDKLKYETTMLARSSSLRDPNVYGRIFSNSSEVTGWPRVELKASSNGNRLSRCVISHDTYTSVTILANGLHYKIRLILFMNYLSTSEGNSSI